MTQLTDMQTELSETSETDYSGLSALFINCTLKRSPRGLEHSGPDGHLGGDHAPQRRRGRAHPRRRPRDRYRRVAGHDRARLGARRLAGDLRDGHGGRHPRPRARRSGLARSPRSATQIIERLYGNSHLLNDAGQYAYYGRVGGCLVTGNEDGVKHCAMNILYSLQHLGYVIPPQADAGWIGEAGPGPSYLDQGSGGPENDFTNRNTTFMTWNLLHLARMLKDAGGIPAHGNQRSAWDAGCSFDFPNPGVPLSVRSIVAEERDSREHATNRARNRLARNVIPCRRVRIPTERRGSPTSSVCPSRTRRAPVAADGRDRAHAHARRRCRGEFPRAHAGGRQASATRRCRRGRVDLRLR